MFAYFFGNQPNRRYGPDLSYEISWLASGPQPLPGWIGILDPDAVVGRNMQQTAQSSGTPAGHNRSLTSAVPFGMLSARPIAGGWGAKMGQRGITSLFAAMFLGISPGAHHAVHAKPDPSLTPTVSFVMNSPILTQQSPWVWTTMVLVDSSPTCLPALRYQFVMVSPDALINGTAGRAIPVQPTGSAEIKCGKSAGQDYEVPLSLNLRVPFSTVPIGATLVVDQPGGKVTPTAIPLTLHRLVTGRQYLWIPIICGAVMALLLVVLIGAVPRLRAFSLDQQWVRPFSRRFWTRPLYATAAWTFKDSWATNIAAAGTAIAGILTAAGAVSTLFPGVQLDRYAILIAACGAIIVAAPLVFGVFNVMCSKSRLIVPDDAVIKLPPQASQKSCIIRVPDGASITFPGGVLRHGHPLQGLSAGASAPVPPDRAITVRGGRIALAATVPTVIAVVGGSTISAASDLTIVPSGAASQGVGANVAAAAGAGLVKATEEIGVPDAGAAVTVTGVADITLPAETELVAPGSARIKLRSAANFKIPAGTNMIMADMRSVIPAAIVTMFGIGAELGIVGVLAGSLSAAALQARIIAVVVVAVMAAVTLWYAVATTRALGNFTSGSALSADGTSYTL